VLLVYLLALGAGSAWASRFGGRWAGVRAHLAIAHALMALALLVAVSMVNRLPYWYLQVYQSWKPETFAAILALSVGIVLAALLWPVLFAGTVLPLVLVGALEGRTESAGPVVGRLYAVNTAGAILGAVLTGFCLIPLVGSESTLLGVAAVAAAMGCLFAVAGRQPSWLRVLAFSAAAAVALGVSARPDWDFLELHVGVFEPSRITVQNPTTLKNRGERAVYAREGPTASVLVAQEASGERNLIINARGNASDAPTDMTTQVLLAQVPLLVAPRTDDVVFAQWLQKYQISLDTYRSILAALQSVFPEVVAFNLGASMDSVLIGSRRPLRLDVAELDRRWNGPELGRVGLHATEDFLARFLLGPGAVRALVEGARVNTDNNMYVEFNGPRDMVLAVGADTFSAVEQRASPVEEILADPRALLASRERLERLIAALR